MNNALHVDIENGDVGRFFVRYPWFDAALRAACTGQEDIPIHIALTYNFRFGPGIASGMRDIVVIESDSGIKTDEMALEDEIIDKFLSHGEYRVVARDDTPEMFAEPDEDEEGDEFVTEKMAEIYLMQGDNRRAMKIYERLSLLNPEKSVYFAGIMDRICIPLANQDYNN